MIGNFSLYPADQPGTFLLEPGAGSAPALLADKRAGETDVRLVFEPKRVDETAAWTPVEVTIAQPKCAFPRKIAQRQSWRLLFARPVFLWATFVFSVSMVDQLFKHSPQKHRGHKGRT